MSGRIVACGQFVVVQWVPSPFCNCAAHVLVANVWKEDGARLIRSQSFVACVWIAADVDNAITITVGANVGYELLAYTLKQQTRASGGAKKRSFHFSALRNASGTHKHLEQEVDKFSIKFCCRYLYIQACTSTAQIYLVIAPNQVIKNLTPIIHSIQSSPSIPQHMKSPRRITRLQKTQRAVLTRHSSHYQRRKSPT